MRTALYSDYDAQPEIQDISLIRQQSCAAAMILIHHHCFTHVLSLMGSRVFPISRQFPETIQGAYVLNFINRCEITKNVRGICVLIHNKSRYLDGAGILYNDYFPKSVRNRMSLAGTRQRWHISFI
jgi:hypothetical protein